MGQGVRCLFDSEGGRLRPFNTKRLDTKVLQGGRKNGMVHASQKQVPSPIVQGIFISSGKEGGLLRPFEGHQSGHHYGKALDKEDEDQQDGQRSYNVRAGGEGQVGPDAEKGRSHDHDDLQLGLDE